MAQEGHKEVTELSMSPPHAMKALPSLQTY